MISQEDNEVSSAQLFFWVESPFPHRVSTEAVSNAKHYNHFSSSYF